MNVLNWRNRDADVQIDLQFRNDEDDPDENTAWIEVSDGQCDNSQWDDTEHTKEPSRHVEIILFVFGFRLAITVCVILRAAKDVDSKQRQTNYRIAL
jgi:hypothetical protein